MATKEELIVAAIDALFLRNDTISIVSQDTPEKTVFHLEDEIGDCLTEPFDTWQEAVLSAGYAAVEPTDL